MNYCLCALFASFIGSSALHAQTNVFVENGEILGEVELLSGLFMGQSFNLTPGTFFEVNSGGTIGPTPSSDAQNPFDFGGSTINLYDGARFSGFLQPASVVSNMTMNAYAGSVAFDLYITGPNSVLNLNGGALFLGSASLGSTINMNSGTVGSGYSISGESVLNISGGDMGGLFRADVQSSIEMTGGRIGINGSVHNGSTLNMHGGTIGAGFRAETGSSVNVYGGIIEGDLTARWSTVRISGGDVGDGFESIGSDVYIDGGRVGDSFLTDFGGTVSLSAGSIGDNFVVGPLLSFGTHVVASISGGSIGDRATVRSRGTLNITGGSIGAGFQAYSGSTINLFVTELSIDGIGMDLIYDEAIVITDRGGALLEATLADGSFLDFTLNSNAVAGEDLFTTGALISVTLVPAPGVGLVVGMAGLFVSRRRRD